MKQLRRDEIWKIADCPTCNARSGDRCFQKNGKKKKSTNHHSRMVEAQRISGFGVKVTKKRAPVHRRKRKVKNDNFYSSWEWKKLRFETLERLGRRCMCCGWSPGDTSSGYLCVDHIKPRSRFPKLELEPSNMQVLCNSCNMGKSNVSTARFDEFGSDEERHWMDEAYSLTVN